jgi:hypothetical protein
LMAAKSHAYRPVPVAHQVADVHPRAEVRQVAGRD